jgi:Rrf2 family protein
MNTHFAIAVHALALLASEGGGPLTSSYIAASVGTNPVFLRRCLRDLQRAGLVEIQRGSEGGVRLARPAGETPLDEVYAAVTAGTPLFKTHLAPSSKCPVGRNAAVSLGAVFSDADAALRRHLRGKSVADVLAGILETDAARTGASSES